MKTILKHTAALLCLWSAAISLTYAGSWQNNVSVGGFTRVHIYTPDTQSAVGDGRALLIVLHGCVQSIDAYLTANLEDAAEQFGMVIAVPDAMNKAGYSCWSYWQGTKSRSSGDYANLINLATTMSSTSSYNIDSDQVYIAGLSSGAAFANTTACLAPDIFAGMGISAGPSIGTSSSGALGSCEYADVATRCQTYAGSYSGDLQTQVASIAHGDADTTVDQCYNRQNAEGMASVYGVSELSGSTILGSGTRTAEEILWQDNRVSMLWLNGVDHSWSGGQGASGSYISGSGINYALYLGEYFANNNQRVSRNEAPVVNSVSAAEQSSALVINGSASDSDGSVDAINVIVEDNAANQYQYTATVDSNDAFSVTTATLADALYFVSVTATDNEGAISEPVTTSVRVGPEPAPTAPVLSAVQVAVSAQCATVTGNIYDENQNLASVAVAFANTTVTADVSGQSFTAEQCNLAGGAQSAVVTATDSGGLQSSETVSFTIDAGVTTTLTEHINAGRLDYTSYSNCYLEYGTDAFKLSEYASGDACVWQDDDASCVGPTVSCSGSDGGDDSGDSGDTGSGDPSNCAEYSVANYYHKVAGRAYSTGNIFYPEYFATGSNDAMSGSTWGITSLYSNDGSNWYVGSCP